MARAVPDDAYCLERLGLTASDVDELVRENPSLRSFIIGYGAERRLARVVAADPLITDLGKPDDHDRRRKGDRLIGYRGRQFRLESKSLQSNSVKEDAGGRLRGLVQIDASDRREVRLADGSTVETTCLLVDDLDIVALNLFAFAHEWRFGFVAAADLPRTRHRPYSAYQRRQLLATSFKVSWPLEAPVFPTLRAALDSTIDR